jgi:hypothetical protein
MTRWESDWCEFAAPFDKSLDRLVRWRACRAVHPRLEDDILASVLIVEFLTNFVRQNNDVMVQDAPWVGFRPDQHNAKERMNSLQPNLEFFLFCLKMPFSNSKWNEWLLTKIPQQANYDKKSL